MNTTKLAYPFHSRPKLLRNASTLFSFRELFALSLAVVESSLPHSVVIPGALDLRLWNAFHSRLLANLRVRFWTLAAHPLRFGLALIVEKHIHECVVDKYSMCWINGVHDVSESGRYVLFSLSWADRPLASWLQRWSPWTIQAYLHIMNPDNKNVFEWLFECGCKWTRHICTLPQLLLETLGKMQSPTPCIWTYN